MKKDAPMEIEAHGLSHKGTIKPFDLNIHKGEVVGLTGLLAPAAASWPAPSTARTRPRPVP